MTQDRCSAGISRNHGSVSSIRAMLAVARLPTARSKRCSVAVNCSLSACVVTATACHVTGYASNLPWRAVSPGARKDLSSPRSGASTDAAP